jgi:deazaflavin-dependent oxidoreductase (nitroreductase family)
MTTTTTSRSTGAGELMRVFTRVTDPITRPLAGTRFFKLWAVVQHVGRRSGTHYATPVAIVTTPDGFVIPLPWGKRTQWARNVLEAGGCQLQWGGSEYSLVDPELIGRDQADLFFSRALRIGLSTFGMSAFLRLRKAPSRGGRL